MRLERLISDTSDALGVNKQMIPATLFLSMLVIDWTVFSEYMFDGGKCNKGPKGVLNMTIQAMV